MEENSGPSSDSGASFSEESMVGARTQICANICTKLPARCPDKRDLRAAEAGAFQERQDIAYAVPFPPLQWKEQATLLPDLRAAEHLLARQHSLPEWKAFLVSVLMFLSRFERRFAALEAVTEAISARVRVSSPRSMLPSTSSAVESVPTDHVAEQSAPSECQQFSNDDDRCQQPDAVLGSPSVVHATSRRVSRSRFRREMSPPTQPVADRTKRPAHVSEPRGVEHEQRKNDGTVSQPATANSFATYEPNWHEPEIGRQPHLQQGHFHDVRATDYASFTWTRDILLALWLSRTSAKEYVEEVFSPVSEVSGYQVKFYARCVSKGDCAVFSFCAQLCANVKNCDVPWPFRGTLKFIIHHPTCSTKSRIYIVPTLQKRRNIAVSDVGKTLFRLTGPIPALALYSEGFWDAASLRLSISVRA
ncbi:hypothetical protein MTO96_050870 [Rhipicephalus appendiculatus]